MLFSYELFDAQPVHRLVGRADGSVGELLVDLDEGGSFTWVEGELSDPDLVGLLAGSELVPGQIADLAPQWRPLYARLARGLGRGLLVSCDYGFERERLLDRRVRMHGTLACYQRHRVHRDPFRAVGEQDLTAHVDFSALREEGERQGLKTLAFTRQAMWLAASGIFEELEGADVETRREARELLDPAGMGVEIRVLIQAREVSQEGLFDLPL
jgi:SAM-dependent MidA family methyltransferase